MTGQVTTAVAVEPQTLRQRDRSSLRARLMAWINSVITFRDSHRRDVVDRLAEMTPKPVPRTSWRPAVKVTKARNIQEWKAQHDNRRSA